MRDQCSRCPAPAFLRVDNHTVMCAACWTLTIARVTEQMKADFENTEACGGMEGHAESGQGGRKVRDVDPFDSGTLNNEAGIKPGPQDSFTPYSNPPGVKPVTDGSLSPLDRSPAAFDDGIPEQFRRARVA